MTNIIFILLIIFFIAGGLFYIKYTPPEDSSLSFILLITLIAGPVCWFSFLIELFWQVFKYFIYVLNGIINKDIMNE